MKRLLLLLVLLTTPLTVFAQQKVSADDLAGEWKVMFNIAEEAEDADSALERMAKKAVAGFMDEIDIRFEFGNGGILIVSVVAFEEDADVDSDAEWMINRHGGLIIGENDHFQSDEDSVFFWEDGELVAFELNEDGKPGERKSITLRRVDA